MYRALILPLLCLAIGGCEQSAPEKQPQAPAEPAAEGEATGRLDRSHAGAQAPTIPIENPEGGPATLAEFRGKPLLVNLWATWCAPCVAEMPTLDALAVREEGKITVLTVSQDMNGQDKVDAFFEKHGFKMLEPYIDPELNLMAELKVDTLPTTILYDAQGREVWRMMGMEDWTGGRAATLIGEAAAGS